MKKIMTVILLIALVFALAACDIVSGAETKKETPSQALTNIITAIKDVNKDELTKYGAKELIGSTDELSNTRNKKIFETLEFNIISIDESEKSAEVRIELKTKDLTTVPQSYADKSAVLTYENNNLGDNKLDAAAMKNKYNDLFVTIIDECEYKEFKEVVDIHLTKEGNSWKISLNSEFYNAIHGNLVTAQNQVAWPGVNNNTIVVQEKQQEEPEPAEIYDNLSAENSDKSNVQNNSDNITGGNITPRKVRTIK